MKTLFKLSIAALLLSSSIAYAGSDLQVTVSAPELGKGLGLLVLNSTYNGYMSIVNKVCSNTSCSFTVKGSTFWHWKSDPDWVTLTLGLNNDKNCTLKFDDNGGFLHRNAEWVSTTCTPGWNASNFQNGRVTITFSE